MKTTASVWIEKLSDKLFWLGAIIFIPAMTVLVCAGSIMRYGFNAPISGGDEYTGLLLFLTFLFAVPHCTYQNKNIKIDLIYKNFGPRLKAVVDLFATLSGIIVMLLISYQAILEVPEMIELEAYTDVSEVPLWPFNVILAMIGVLLLALFVFKTITVFNALMKLD